MRESASGFTEGSEGSEGQYALAPQWDWLRGFVAPGNFMASMTRAERFLGWRALAVDWWDRMDGGQRRVLLGELRKAKQELLQEEGGRPC